MRAGEHYDCTRCGARGALEAMCEPRCSHARDQHGNAPPPLSEDRYEWPYPKSVTTFLSRSMVDLAVLLKRQRRRKKLRGLVDAAGPARTIFDALGGRHGLCCIEGEVEVVDPAAVNSDLAAYFSREVHSATHGNNRTVEHIVVRRGAGSFWVHDASGSAYVDDDWILLLDGEGAELDARHSGSLEIVHAQRVRVIGHARRGERFAPGAGRSYRSRQHALELVGGTGRPVVLIPLPGE